MLSRTLEPVLVLGLLSTLALSTATSSIAQTQRQRPSADETFGQAMPRAQTDPMANQPGSCWIPTNEDFGVGYWGPCSDKKSRPVK
jgi:hypothetical protein